MRAIAVAAQLLAHGGLGGAVVETVVTLSILVVAVLVWLGMRKGDPEK